MRFFVTGSAVLVALLMALALWRGGDRESLEGSMAIKPSAVGPVTTPKRSPEPKRAVASQPRSAVGDEPAAVPPKAPQPSLDEERRLETLRAEASDAEKNTEEL